MFELTVKTLDGQAKSFSLPDEITVREFKEKIVTSLNIPFEQQRIIFLGRALRDDDILKSCDCDGKVVHLVSRPPPDRTSNARSDNEEDMEMDFDMGVSASIPTRVDPNQMRDMVREIMQEIGGTDAQQVAIETRDNGRGVDIHVNIPHGSQRQSLARLRRDYLRRVERQARHVLHHLEEPSSVAPSPDNRVLHLRNDFLSNDQSETPSPPQSTAADATAPSSTEDLAQPLPVDNLADMLDSVLNLLRDAQPQLQRWQRALRRQDIGATATPASQAQVHFDGVQRFLHMLAHMLHNVSDFIVETSQPEPRHLLVMSEVPMHQLHLRMNVDSHLNSIPEQRSSTTTSGENNTAATTTTDDTSNRQNSSSRTSDEENGATVSSARSDRHRRHAASESSSRTTFATNLPPIAHDMMSRIQRRQQDGGAAVPSNNQTYHTANFRFPDNGSGLAFNSLSAHVITTSSANSTSSSNANSGSTPSDLSNSADSASGMGGLPNDVMREVLRNAIRQGMNANHSSYPAGLFGRGRGLGSSQRGLGPHNVHGHTPNVPPILNNVDPFLNCNSRHYMDDNAMSESRSGTSIHLPQSIGFIMGISNDASGPDAGGGRRTNFIYPTIALNNSESSSRQPAGQTNTAAPGQASAATFQFFSESASAAGGGLSSSDISAFQSLLESIPGMATERSMIEVMESIGLHEIEELHGAFLNDLFVVMVRRLSASDLCKIFVGDYSALDQVRQSVQSYLREHMLREGQSEESVRSEQDVVDAIVAEWRPVLGGAVAGLDLLLPRLRVVISLEQALRDQLSRGLSRLLSAQSDVGFGVILHSVVFGVVDHVGSLVRRAFGQKGFRSFCERLLRQWTTLSTESLGNSSFNNPLITNIGVQLIRSRLEGWHPNVEVRKYYVFEERPKPLLSTELAAKRTTEHPALESTPVGWQNGSDLVENPLMASADSLNALTAAAAQSDSKVVESWQSVIPADWIPIIQHDVRQLQEVHAQENGSVVFSDGYVGGQPAKRRKIVMSERADRSLQSSEMVLVETLREAAALESSSVSRSSIEAAVASAPANEALTSAFSQYAAQRVAMRLSTNPDYSSERFPRTQQAFLSSKRAPASVTAADNTTSSSTVNKENRNM